MALQLAHGAKSLHSDQNVRSSELPPLGYVDWDCSTACNERIIMQSPILNRTRIIRDHFVRIDDPVGSRSGFLGRIVAGPFFSPRGAAGRGSNVSLGLGQSGEVSIFSEIELQGELVDGQSCVSQSRPVSRAAVHELSPEEVSRLLGLAGNMVLGSMAGQDDVWLRLQSANKGVLPRNLGIFGTVGSGKSNTAQVVIEEAAANGWAVIVLDVESEYVEMDKPSQESGLAGKLAHFQREPCGVADFQVFYPASCANECERGEPFILRLADFESAVIAELLQTTIAERNALLDCIEFLDNRAKSKVATREAEGLTPLLDASPKANLAFSLRSLNERAGDRSTRNNDFFDYTGLSSKLNWLMQAGAFDLPNMRSLDIEGMLKPGRVSVIDVSIANDIIKNLVTADVLRKAFAYKLARPEAPPTLLVVEEAHSFISREKAQTMHATLQMLRNVARRGRKRWLSLCFVSQQPGHLPPEIFELCNTRIVHTLRSMHNLEVLTSTAGDVSREMWARCPLLGPGEAIVTSPQLKRAVIAHIRPAMSERKFVD